MSLGYFNLMQMLLIEQSQDSGWTLNRSPWWIWCWKFVGFLSQTCIRVYRSLMRVKSLWPHLNVPSLHFPSLLEHLTFRLTALGFNEDFVDSIISLNWQLNQFHLHIWLHLWSTVLEVKGHIFSPPNILLFCFICPQNFPEGFCCLCPSATAWIQDMSHPVTMEGEVLMARTVANHQWQSRCSASLLGSSSCPILYTVSSSNIYWTLVVWLYCNICLLIMGECVHYLEPVKFSAATHFCCRVVIMLYQLYPQSPSEGGAYMR